MALTLSPLGCTDEPASEDETAETAQVAEPVLPRSKCGVKVLNNVTFLPATFHWEDPRHLLSAAEGAGPRDLTVTVSKTVAAQVSVTGTSAPEDSSISESVGFDVSKEASLEASSTIYVPAFGYSRLEAYPLYQQVTFDVVVDTCGPRGGLTWLGSGIVYKPIGIYFATTAVQAPPVVIGGYDDDYGLNGAGGSGGAGGAGGTGGAGGSGGTGGAGGGWP